MSYKCNNNTLKIDRKKLIEWWVDIQAGEKWLEEFNVLLEFHIVDNIMFDKNELNPVLEMLNNSWWLGNSYFKQVQLVICFVAMKLIAM